MPLAVELRLGDLDRLEQSSRLADRLLVFGGRVTIVNDPAAGLDVRRLPLEDQGP